VKGHAIYFGDVHAGVVAVREGGRTRIVAQGLATPEGIVPRDTGHLYVVEQGRNRLDLVTIRTGRVRVLQYFRNTTGQEGVDGIGRGPDGSLLIPDSPYGSLWRRDRNGSWHLLHAGFGRPVDALRYRGGIAVADENDNAVWLLRNGHVTRLATVPTPDDVAILRGHLYAVTLGDGGLWEIRPRVVRLPISFRDPQGLAVQGRVLIVADSTLNALYRVSLAGC